MKNKSVFYYANFSIFCVLFLMFNCGFCDDSPYMDYGLLKPVPQRVIYENNSKAFELTKVATYELLITENLVTEAQLFVQRLRDLSIIDSDIDIIRDSALSLKGEYVAILRLNKCWNGPGNSPANVKKMQGYSMQIDPEGFMVIGADLDGAFYGLQTILQVLNIARDTQKKIPAALISDWPDIPNRSILLVIKSLHKDSDLSYFKKILEALANLKYNNVFFEFSFALPGPQYAFPGLTGPDKTPLKDEMASQLCDFARSLHMEVNLAFQFGGHCTWLLYEPAYCNMGESPPARFAWPNTNWSPANPKLWEIVEDLVTHQINVCKPKRVHIAHDEMAYGEFNKSISSLEANLSNEELISLGINKLRKIIPADIKMHVWFDLFMPDEVKVEENRTFASSEKMMQLTPKDMVMNMWFYSGEPEHVATAEYFKKHKRKFWTSTFKASNVARVCYYTDLLGAEGVMGTHWFETNSEWNNPRNISSQAMQAIIALGSFSWNSSTIDNLVELDSAGFFKMIAEGSKPIDYSLFDNINVDLSKSANFPSEQLESLYPMLADLVKKIDMGRGKYLTREKLSFTGAVLLAGKSSEKDILPTKILIPINRKVSSVSFYHTANVAVTDAGMGSWQKATAHPKLGSYKLIFGDSEEEVSCEIPLEYRWNIQDWNNLYGSYDSKLVWLYTTGSGVIMQIQKYVWHPDNEQVRFLKAVEFSSDITNGMNPLLLQITTHTPLDKKTSLKINGDEFIWGDDFEYESNMFLQERWKGGREGLKYGIPTLDTKIIKSGQKSLMWEIIPSSVKLRSDIGVQTEIINVAKGNKLFFSIRTQKPDTVVKDFICSLYLGNTKNGYWYQYGFGIPADGEWKTYELSLSSAFTEGVVPEEGGMADLDTVKFSIWHQNKEPVLVFIDDLKIIKSNDPALFNTVR